MCTSAHGSDCNEHSSITPFFCYLTDTVLMYLRDSYDLRLHVMYDCRDVLISSSCHYLYSYIPCSTKNKILYCPHSAFPEIKQSISHYFHCPSLTVICNAHHPRFQRLQLAFLTHGIQFPGDCHSLVITVCVTMPSTCGNFRLLAHSVSRLIIIS